MNFYHSKARVFCRCWWTSLQTLSLPLNWLKSRLFQSLPWEDARSGILQAHGTLKFLELTQASGRVSQLLLGLLFCWMLARFLLRFYGLFLSGSSNSKPCCDCPVPVIVFAPFKRRTDVEDGDNRLVKGLAVAALFSLLFYFGCPYSELSFIRLSNLLDIHLSLLLSCLFFPPASFVFWGCVFLCILVYAAAQLWNFCFVRNSAHHLKKRRVSLLSFGKVNLLFSESLGNFWQRWCFHCEIVFNVFVNQTCFVHFRLSKINDGEHIRSG